MKETVHKLISNELLMALSRVLVVIGTPIMIAVLTWFTGNFIGLQQTVSLISLEQRRIIGDVKELQDFRAETMKQDRKTAEDISAIKEILVSQQRSLTRIEAIMDRSSRP